MPQIQDVEGEAAPPRGAGKYIKKPYTLEKVGLAVKEELEKQAVFDPQLDWSFPISLLFQSFSRKTETYIWQS